MLPSAEFQRSSSLLTVLGERWWDTTLTFHWSWRDDDDPGGYICVDGVTFWWGDLGTECQEEDDSYRTEGCFRMVIGEDYLGRYSAHSHGSSY